jgi:hypothetical protein
MLRGRFKRHHERCLQAIAKIPEFTGTIIPGEALDTGDGASMFTTTNKPSSSAGPSTHFGGGEDTSTPTREIDDERVALEQEVEDEEENEELSRDLLDILHVSSDSIHLEE